MKPNNNKTFIIAEAGVNHDGSLQKALKLINVAAAAGANAIKFQTFRAENLATDYAPKAEYQKYEEMDLPAERFTTFDAVNFGNNFFDTSIEEEFTGDLKGVGCCPGKVKGRVRVVKHPREVASMNGDILVTSSTDPGWVTLFPSSSAIIVERGSLLSHSAIVSREMGIPCIVSVTGLLKTLKTGDLIEMDGSTGMIKLLEDE